MCRGWTSGVTEHVTAEGAIEEMSTSETVEFTARTVVEMLAEDGLLVDAGHGDADGDADPDPESAVESLGGPRGYQ